MDEILTGQERIFESRRASSAAASPSRTSASRSTMRRSGRSTRSSLQAADNWPDPRGAGGSSGTGRQGLERKPRLLALKRQAVDLEGEQGEYANRIAQAREAIAESELEIIRMEADDQREVATDLREFRCGWRR